MTKFEDIVDYTSNGKSQSRKLGTKSGFPIWVVGIWALHPTSVGSHSAL